MTIYLSSLRLHTRAQMFTQIPLGFDKPLEMRKMPLKQVVLTPEDIKKVTDLADLSVSDFVSYHKKNEDTADRDQTEQVLPTIAHGLKSFFNLSEDELEHNAAITKSTDQGHIYITYPYSEVVNGTKIVVYLNATIEFDDRPASVNNFHVVEV